MSAKKNEPENPLETGTSGGSVNINLKDLAALIAQATETASVKSAEMLAKALIDSRKPYVSPEEKQNEDTFRRTTAELEQRIRENLRASQATCPHKQGCNDLSESMSQSSSFVMHRLDTGLVWGICTNCQKQIFSNREADRQFFREKSGNRMSEAGRRIFFDQNKAILDGMPTGYLDAPEKKEVAAVAQK